MLKTSIVKKYWLPVILFVAFTTWWVYIDFVLKSSSYTDIQNQLFAGVYGVMALVGGIFGLIASKKWGGFKSLFGRSLMFFALGLLAQEFGQIAYSYYLYVSKVNIPYPSVGDVGYFGSALFYIYGAYLLAKGIGLRYSLKNPVKKIVAAVIPLAMLIFSYTIFLRGYQFDFSSFKAGLTVFLDFGYPFSQAIYIAIALLAYLFSLKLLGGKMKMKVLLLLFALVVQYVADFTFLNNAKAQKVYPAGINDYIYFISYSVMTLALLRFKYFAEENKSDTAQEETDG